MRLGWRLFHFIYLLFSTSMVMGPLYALFTFNYQQPIWSISVFILFVLGIIAMGVYTTRAALDILSGKLMLHLDRMEYKSLIRQSTIPYAEIRGFQARLGASVNSGTFIPREVIAIVPLQNIRKRKIKMSPYINDHEVLLQWLQKNFNELLGRKHVDD